MLVVTKEKEQFVFKNRATDRSTPLLTKVNRFCGGKCSDPVGKSGCKRSGIAATIAIVAIVIESVTVKLISSAFCNCIGYTASGASVLSGIVGRVDLKFADSRLADDIVNTCSSALSEKKA